MLGLEGEFGICTDDAAEYKAPCALEDNVGADTIVITCCGTEEDTVEILAAKSCWSCKDWCWPAKIFCCWDIPPLPVATPIDCCCFCIWYKGMIKFEI